MRGLRRQSNPPSRGEISTACLRGKTVLRRKAWRGAACSARRRPRRLWEPLQNLTLRLARGFRGIFHRRNRREFEQKAAKVTKTDQELGFHSEDRKSTRLN